MITAFNLQPVAVRGLTGIGNYTAQVARRLADEGSEIHAFDFLGKNGAAEILQENLDMDLRGRDLHIVRSLPLSVYIRMGRAGRLVPYKTLTGSSADITFFFNYLTPGGLTGRNVITIYDLVSERFPETMQARNRRLLQGHLRDSASRASAILTISEFSKSEITEVLGIPEDRIFVGPCGVDCDYYTPGNGFETDIAACHDLGRYILYVGTLEPRKNIRTIIEAFNLISGKFPDVKLVLAGGLGWQSGETLDAIAASPGSDRIVRCGYVSNSQKRDLLRNCEFFVFPSIYEGFGMPVTEAMACGKDAVVADTSSLSEVAGDLLTKVPPGDADLFAQVFEYKLQNPADGTLRERLRLRAGGYTWEKAAQAARDAIAFADMIQ